MDTILGAFSRRRASRARAGIPVAGGHSVDSVEPIYGLVAIGLVDPRHVKHQTRGARATRSSSASARVGISAPRQDAGSTRSTASGLASTTQLNAPPARGFASGGACMR